MRWNKPLIAAAALLALGSGPLILYVVFGPRDGNPIGLGLLFFFSFPFTLALGVWGGLLMLLEKRRGESDGPRLGRDGSRTGGNRNAGGGRHGPGGSRSSWPREKGDDWP